MYAGISRSKELALWGPHFDIVVQSRSRLLKSNDLPSEEDRIKSRRDAGGAHQSKATNPYV